MRGSTLKFQTSAGGVVFRKKSNKIEIVLVTLNDGKVWCLPKGLVDKGETPEMTAVREVEEETGLKVKILRELGKINYWYYLKEEDAKCKKTVYFYLMECTGGDVKKHDWEVESAEWISIDDAMKKATYKSEKEIIKKAFEVLKEY